MKPKPTNHTDKVKSRKHPVEHGALRLPFNELGNLRAFDFDFRFLPREERLMEACHKMREIDRVATKAQLEKAETTEEKNALRLTPKYKEITAEALAERLHITPKFVKDIRTGLLQKVTIALFDPEPEKRFAKMAQRQLTWKEQENPERLADISPDDFRKLRLTLDERELVKTARFLREVEDKISNRALAELHGVNVRQIRDWTRSITAKVRGGAGHER